MVITTTLCALALTLPLGEEEYYEIATIPIPDEIVLEVSAIEILKDGTALVAPSSRRRNIAGAFIFDDLIKVLHSFIRFLKCSRFSLSD